ncbi:hypothetical protein C0V82_16865 [Niveispirillum cyanobacteriorum]|uniref:Uncharacterized protein n=2 Tax=Niveispirillum cyanobacteriorum TaxID=1612173 RepID=A0A2K9NG67_9PROT|nr:hypothetical protein C0V82_16865 [Niveispirillum cyanobacteriorum]
MIAALLLLGVASAGAQEQAKPAAEAIVQTAPADNDGGRLICKTEKETGSRVKRNKVCKTKQEWDDMRLNTNKQLNEYSKQTPANPLPSS